MKITNKKIFIIIPFLLMMFSVLTVFAAGQGNFCESCGKPGDAACGSGLECRDNKCQYSCPAGGVCIPNPLKSCSFDDLINSVINFIFYVGLAISVLMGIIGAFYLLTSAGDPKRVQTAKSIFIYTFIGLLILILAKGLVSVVKAVLGG